MLSFISLPIWFVVLVFIFLGLLVLGFIPGSILLYVWFKKRCRLVPHEKLRNCSIICLTFWFSSFVSIIITIIVEVIQASIPSYYSNPRLELYKVIIITGSVFLLFQILFFVFLIIFRVRFKKYFTMVTVQNIFKLSHMTTKQ